MHTTMSLPLDTKHTDWNEIEFELNRSFDLLLLKINERRSALLDKLNFLKAEDRDMPELIQRMKNQLLNLGSKMSDTTKSFHNREIELWGEGIHDYQFVWNVAELNLLLDKLGDIVKVPDIYKTKTDPKLTFGQGQVLLASGLAVDERNGLIAVGELESESVIIYNKEGELVNKLSNGQMTVPNSLVFDEEESLFVSDYHNQLILKFTATKTNFSEMQLSTTYNLSQFQYGFITALDFDRITNNLFGTLEKYHKILVFDSNLDLIDSFNPGLQFPQDIKVKHSHIFVLDYNNPCLHVISKINGTKLFSLVPRGLDYRFSSPQLFTLDSNNNIFVTDVINNRILMYTPSGHLTCVLFQSGQSKGELFIPAGLHVTSSDEIIVLSQNSSFPVQIF